MGFDLERVLNETEDFLRRNVIRSRAAQEAKKRRARRKMEEAMRRVRRAGLILVGLLGALVLASILLGSFGILTWLVAIPTVLLFALISLSWPTRRRSEPVAADVPGASLAEMARRAEEGLLDRSDQLPGRALGASDAIISRLNELQPHLDSLEPNSMLAGDARRLICQHLPRLVDTYLDLPASARAPNSEPSRRFAESLGIVANEMDDLLEQCCRDRHLSFDTQHRFIETRYREDPRLKGE
jgi:hypothetical protein